MKLFFTLVFLAASLSNARPANDWTKPCFHGECAYDLPGTHEAGYGTFKLYGSPKSITDITPAAGWIILDCSPDLLAQDIRLVCKSSDATKAGCNHLFNHGGPVDKLVRLPESCGQGPFARISRARVAEDQFIPSHIQGQITRRDGVVPEVHILSVDDAFDAVNPEKAGPVYFSLLAANIPGMEDDIAFDPGSVYARSENWSFSEWFHKTVKKVKKAFKAIGDFIEEKTTYKFDKKHPLKPFKPHIPSKDLINWSKECPPVTAALKVTASAHADVRVTVGAIASGSIVPWDVKEFGAMIGVKADLGAKLKVHASLSGELDSGRREIFSKGIPPLEIPGIIRIGPALELQAQAKATLEINLDLDLDITYHVDYMEFWWPSSASKSRSSPAKPKDTPLKLSATPSISVKGTIEAHIIPRIKMGISGANGNIKADVFLEADTSATLTLEASASHTISTREDHDMKDLAMASPKGVNLWMPPYKSASRDLAMRAADLSFKGCVGLDLGIAIQGGVEGKFFSLWNGNKTFDPFWKGSFEIFKKCWSSGSESESESGSEGGNERRYMISDGLTSSLEQRSKGGPKGHGKCLSKKIGKAENVTSKTVKASEIKRKK